MATFDDEKALDGYLEFLNGSSSNDLFPSWDAGATRGQKVCRPIGTSSLPAERQMCRRSLFSDPLAASGLSPSIKKIIKDVQQEAFDREEARKELRYLRKSYGGSPRSARGSLYCYRRGGRWHYRIDAYLRDRKNFFGSSAAYKAAKQRATQQLDANNGFLRKRIDPPLSKRKYRRKYWKEGQNIFYTWLVRAYEKKYSPERVDVPKLIKQGSSPRLRKALRQVQSDYGRKVSRGGFNPRPVKRKGAYMLGTLSEHATGMAIDIEARKNPQITNRQWRLIEHYTGTDLTAADRRLWKTKPKALHAKIKSINDAWVRKLKKAIAAEQAAIKREEAAAAKAGKSPVGKGTALARVIKKNSYLRRLEASKFVSKYYKGFLTLDEKLIKELHEEGFVWGATFGTNVDLHHFRLK